MKSVNVVIKLLPHASHVPLLFLLFGIKELSPEISPPSPVSNAMYPVIVNTCISTSERVVPDWLQKTQASVKEALMEIVWWRSHNAIQDEFTKQTGYYGKIKVCCISSWSCWTPFVMDILFWVNSSCMWDAFFWIPATWHDISYHAFSWIPANDQ